jgi:transposase
MPEHLVRADADVQGGNKVMPWRTINRSRLFLPVWIGHATIEQRNRVRLRNCGLNQCRGQEKGAPEDQNARGAGPRQCRKWETGTSKRKQPSPCRNAL